MHPSHPTSYRRSKTCLIYVSSPIPRHFSKNSLVLNTVPNYWYFFSSKRPSFFIPIAAFFTWHYALTSFVHLTISIPSCITPQSQSSGFPGMVRIHFILTFDISYIPPSVFKGKFKQEYFQDCVISVVRAYILT